MVKCHPADTETEWQRPARKYLLATSPPAMKGYLMKQAFLALFLGVGATILASGMATAQQRNCAPRDAVVERLASKYGESRQSIGLGSNNALVEVFASDETGTWTITVTNTSGMTCLVAAGQAFEALAEAPLGLENDA